MQYRHIVPQGTYWIIKREGTSQASKKYERKEDAIASARNDDVPVVVHGKDGNIAVYLPGTKEAKQLTAPILATNRRIHLLHDDGEWQVKTEGASRAIKKFTEKNQGVRFAHAVAERRKTSAVIHDQDGTIMSIDIPEHYRMPLPKERPHEEQEKRER